MVEFRFSAIGYRFQQGVASFRACYERAIAALQADLVWIEASLADYDLAVSRNPAAWDGERDEDGSLLWERSQILELDIEAARRAIEGLRKSFVIAIYHHWERSAVAWTNGKRRDAYLDLRAISQAMGRSIIGWRR